MSTAWRLVERAVSRQAALADAVRRSPAALAHALLAGRANSMAGTRRVKLACGSCGRVAAVIEEHPSGTSFGDYPGLRLLVRSGNVARRHLMEVACPQHGRLRALWAEVLPAAQAARDGRVRTLRLRPVTPASR